MTRRELEIVRSLERSKQQCRELRAENDELWEANGALCIERDATDVLLGEALDLLNQYIEGASR